MSEGDDTDLDASEGDDSARQPNRTAPFLWVAATLAVVVVGIALVVVVTDDGSPEDGTAVEEPADAEPAGTAAADPTTAPTEPGEPVELSIERDTEAAESAADFYARLAASLSSGDLDFALSRLDPAMDDLYGDACADTLAELSEPTFDITFYRQKRIEPWVFEVEEGRVEIDNSVVTVIALDGEGQTGKRAESHLTILDGLYRWFTYC